MIRDQLTFALPRELDASAALKLAGRLYPRDGVRKYVFDFEEVGHITPFAMVVISSALRRFRASRPFDEFFIVNYEHHTYAGHMGFFRAFGPQYGKAPGEAPGGGTYIPVTSLRWEQIQAEVRQSFQFWQQIVEEKARGLARLLLQVNAGPAVETVTFALRELLRNVFEHSKATEVWYCGQYWPTRDVVELAVLDEGRGVRAALSANPHLTIESDYDALKFALLPGVSGTVFQGKRPPRNDPWANSGYGLYMTSQLCREAGEFLICSGDAALRLTTDSELKQTDFAGTALCMRYAPSGVTDVNQTLGALSREGELLARELKGSVLSSSAASRYIRERRPGYRR